MARKADADKRQEDFTTAALSNIERQAAKAYAADKKAAAAAAGSWSWEQDTGYYYNPSHRYDIAWLQEGIGKAVRVGCSSG